MTEGAIWKKLLLFAVPLMAGNLFQQLYNTVDAVVVGNFVGKEGLAAVGSADSLINTFIGFFSGLATGAGVVISQYYGAKDARKVHYAVHTTIALTLVMSIVCTVAALFGLPFMMRLMGIPEDVFPQSKAYLQIYFLGVAGLLFYNMGSGILRAVGDSLRPLLFLIFSAVLNVVLDLVFVVGFRLGIAGVAYATVIAQALSALLVLATLMREKEMYKLTLSKVRFYPRTLQKIVMIGLPSGIQMSVTAFSNVIVQAYINSFGSSIMAGWSSYGKIDKFCTLPIQSIALSITTFMGQNLGAGKYDRVRKSVKTALLLSFGATFVCSVPVWLLADRLIGFFSRDAQVIEYGTMLLRTLTPFYFFMCINQTLLGALRGLGNTRVPMILVMSCLIIFRQVYLFVVTRLSDSFMLVALGYPAGWMLCSLVVGIYYSKVNLAKYKITE